MSDWKRPLFDFYVGDVRLCLGRETKIMGVLNVTPDSFSDGGLYLDPGKAEVQALRMEMEGAHILDVGGESSRPGSRPVSAREELRRVLPVLRRLARKLKIPISVDTTKAEVAEAALGEGARMINDIRALKGNRRLARCIARHNASVVLMHMRGTPRTMQQRTRYRSFFKDILDTLRRAARTALDAGIHPRKILLDPGFGFGKTAEQNVDLLSRLDFFIHLRFPLLVGMSRKSFIGHVLGVPAEDRLYGSLAAAAAAIERGAHILRAHDVLAHRQLAQVVDRVQRVHEEEPA